jgi:endo-1,4-beta-xylanase
MMKFNYILAAALAVRVSAMTTMALDTFQFFGAAEPCNINNTFGYPTKSPYNGPLPFQRYFRMMQGDGFMWWSDMEPSEGYFVLPTAQYNWCKAHNVKVRIFLGGGTSPEWVSGLSADSAETAWETFLQKLSSACPNIDLINIGNEPLSKGTWSFYSANKLGGTGSTGYDWAINAYKIVKSYFPNGLIGWNQWGCEVANQPFTSGYIAFNQACAAANAIDYIGLEFYFGDFRGYNWNWTQTQITDGLNAYHTACPGIPIHITEFTPVQKDDNAQLILTQAAVAAFKADPLVTGLSLWDPDSNYADGESGAGAGFFTNATNFRPAFTWLVNNIPLPTPQ